MVALRLLKCLDFLIHCVKAVVELLQLRLKRTFEGRISLNRSLHQGIFHFLDTFLARAVQQSRLGLVHGLHELPLFLHKVSDVLLYDLRLLL